MDARTIFEGKHVLVLERDGWEFVERRMAREAVAIIALTADDRLVLTEQFRRPVDARVIDLPAGLIERESVADTARRELEEEAGFTCDEVAELATSPTSPGITSEIVHFVRAAGVRRCGPGGGVEGEEIAVHLVPRTEIEPWLRRKSEEGLLIDLKVRAGLYFVLQST